MCKIQFFKTDNEFSQINNRMQVRNLFNVNFCTEQKKFVAEKISKKIKKKH